MLVIVKYLELFFFSFNFAEMSEYNDKYTHSMYLKRSNTMNGSSWLNSRSEINLAKISNNDIKPADNMMSPYIANRILRLPKIGGFHGKTREKVVDEKIYNIIYYNYDKCALNRKQSEYRHNYTQPERSAYRVKKTEVFVKRNDSPFLNENSKKMFNAAISKT